MFYTSNGVYSKDGGIDFVLVNSEKGIECAFQVKRRLTGKPEPIRYVREFLGAVAMSPYDKCYYVTTSSRFTQSGSQVLSAQPFLQHRQIECHLVNGKHLLQLLRTTRIKNELKKKIISQYRSYSKYDWSMKNMIPSNTKTSSKTNECEKITFKEMIANIEKN